MKLKRLTAMISSAVMVFSLLAGVTIAKPAKAAVTSELPTLTGLYVTDWIEHNWDDELQKEVVFTDTDQYGNTVLVDWDGNPHNEYLDQDMMQEYYTEGLEHEYGLSGRAAGSNYWFDYIEDGKKVTHVSLSDLTITHLDGTPCDDVFFSEWNDDPRVIYASSSKVNESVLITYNKGTVNNKFVMNFSLFEGIYSSPTEASLDTCLDVLNVYKKGTTVGYLHLQNAEWNDGRYEADIKNMIRGFHYFDTKKNQEVNLVETGEVSKYLTIKQVSKDPRHLVYKLLVKAIPTSDGWADVDVNYKNYNVEDPANKRDGGCGFHIEFIDGTAPAPAKGTTETIGGIKYKVTGKSAVSVVKGANKASVTIPAKVSIDGTSFKVTAIDAKAFNGCAKVKTLTVKSTTITKVGKNALKALKKKAVAKVPKSKKKAYAKLFKKGGFKGKVK